MSFSYKGIRKDYIIIANFKRPPTSETEIGMVQLPNSTGAIINKKISRVRKIPVELWVDSSTFQSLDLLEEDLSDWLWSEKPEELIADDNVSRTYYATVSSISKPIEIGFTAKIDVLFLATDPYKYGAERVEPFTTGTAAVVNQGYAETPPLYKVTATKESTYLSVSDDKGNFMQLGRQPAESDQAFEPYTLELDKLGNTLVGWTTGNEVDGGVVAGDFTVGGQAFRASGYGTGPAWHGPMRVQALPRLLIDYKIEAFVTLKQGAINQRGRVEVYLMGSGGQRIGKLSMKIDGSESTSNIGEVNIRKGVNSEFLIRTAGVRPRLWNDFYGLLRIEKKGNKFLSYIARIDGGRYNTAWPVEFTDFGNLYTDHLAGIGIHLGAYGTKPPIQDIAIHRIRVYDVNDPSEGQIPIIIETGDIIELDHKHSDIRINGESRPDLKAFAGRFFMLQKGTNLLFLDPPDIGTAEVTFRERFR